MSAAPMTLEFELSKEELIAGQKRIQAQFTSKTYWGHRLSSFFWLGMIYYGWDYQPWWLNCLLFLIVIHSWTFPRWLYWAGWLRTKAGLFPIGSTAIIIETDAIGLTVRHPKHKSRSRFWWSRLTGVDEKKFGLELRFDGRDWGEVLIPWKALQDEQELTAFVDLVKSHLPNEVTPSV